MYFWRCIDYVDIAGRSAARIYNQNIVDKMAIFNLYIGLRKNILQTASNANGFMKHQ